MRRNYFDYFQQRMILNRQSAQQKGYSLKCVFLLLQLHPGFDYDAENDCVQNEMSVHILCDCNNDR